MCFARHHIDGTRRSAVAAALGAEIVERAQAALIAFAPGGNAFVQPVRFGADFTLQLVPLECFVLEKRLAPGLKLGKSTLQPVGSALVEPQGGTGQVFQKPPVMADQH